MKRNHFISLIYCTVVGLTFSLGLCMCLLPEWDLFVPGIILTALGAIGLILVACVYLIKNKENRKPINWKIVLKIAYGVISALILGVGMCLIMVWNYLILGILVGVVGLIMILFLIPMFLGFKD